MHRRTTPCVWLLRTRNDVWQSSGRDSFTKRTPQGHQQLPTPKQRGKNRMFANQQPQTRLIGSSPPQVLTSHQGSAIPVGAPSTSRKIARYKAQKARVGSRSLVMLDKSRQAVMMILCPIYARIQMKMRE